MAVCRWIEEHPILPVNSVVEFHSDNSTTVSYICSQGSAIPELNEIGLWRWKVDRSNVSARALPDRGGPDFAQQGDVSGLVSDVGGVLSRGESLS